MPKNLEQEARTSVLQYFSSKCTAHGTNLLAIAVGFFAYVQSANLVSSFLGPVAHSLIFPFFIAVGIHQIFRLLVWGNLTQTVIQVNPEKIEKKYPKEFQDNKNRIKRLHKACSLEFQDTHKWLAKINSIILWVVLLTWIILFFVTLSIQVSMGQNSQNASSQNSLLDINTLVLLLGQTLIGILSAYVSARFLIARREKRERNRAYGSMLSEVQTNIALSKDHIKALKTDPTGILLGFRDEIYNAFKSTGYFIDLPDEVRTKLVNLYRDIWKVGHKINEFKETRKGVLVGEIRENIEEIILPTLENIKGKLEEVIEE